MVYIPFLERSCHCRWIPVKMPAMIPWMTTKRPCCWRWCADWRCCRYYASERPESNRDRLLLLLLPGQRRAVLPTWRTACALSLPAGAAGSEPIVRRKRKRRRHNQVCVHLYRNDNEDTAGPIPIMERNLWFPTLAPSCSRAKAIQVIFSFINYYLKREKELAT